MFRCNLFCSLPALGTMLFGAWMSPNIASAMSPAEDSSVDASALMIEPEDTVSPPSASTVSTSTSSNDESASSASFNKADYQRVGSTVTLSLGIQGCQQKFCKGKEEFRSFNGGHLGVGSHAGLQFGLRPMTYFDVSGGFSLSYSPVYGADSGDFIHGWYTVDINARAFPLASSRFDPYVGIGLGFTQFWGYSSISDIEITQSLSRGNFLILLGVDIFVTQRFSIGPRFRQNLPFSGRLCRWYEDEEQACDSLADPEKIFGFEGKDAPRAWEFGVALKWHKPLARHQ